MEQTHANENDDFFDMDELEQEEPQVEEEVKEQPKKKPAPRVVRSYVDPDRVGTKKEDIPDLLWLINANVEHLTPEQVR